ncbi:MAG TPA: serine/threonine-protein kinase [Myxococcota bacterium]|nr:serine/threonine-protein kinase [Myxococcota bacterium]
MGRFHLLKGIATGGMAEIYIATQRLPDGEDKLVVIKMLRPELRNNREYVHLFLNEARIASRLMHPNLVQMYDLGYADGNYFIAMEYVHGENAYSIAKAFRKKKKLLPLRHSVRIVRQACLGLQYAHTKTDVAGRPLNIVHCDISPQNIIVSFDGETKVLDFGVARATSNYEKQESKSTVKGKLPYMSPEQVTGKPLDARTDVYAAGTVLWELVTGRRRYQRMENREIFKDIIEGSAPPPNRWNPEIPEQLDAVILKALIKNPDARFQTAEQFASTLDEAARVTGQESTPEDLAAFMRDLFGERIEKAAKIEDALAQGEIEPHLFSDLGAEGLKPHPAATPEIETHAEATGHELDKAAFRPPSTGRRYCLWLGLGVLALLVALAATLFFRAQPAPETSPGVPSGKCMLSVSSTPAGAKVFLDTSERCATPCIVQNLDVGSEHELKIEKPHYRPFSTRFKLDKKFEVKKFDIILKK